MKGRKRSSHKSEFDATTPGGSEPTWLLPILVRILNQHLFCSFAQFSNNHLSRPQF
jgi:hypothetical protein